MPATASVRALETIYREQYRRFVRVAAAISGDEASGVDAVQEAFVGVLKARKGFRGEAPLEAWVWRAVVNAALAAKRTRRPDELLDGEAVQGYSGNGTCSDDELGVRRWIAALPERQRLAVFLRYFADLDYRSIAVALGVETGTVSATLSAAHAALRRRLEEVAR